jgi:hypothetical protein
MMTWDVYTDTEPVARKDYRCDAYDHWLSNYISESDLTGDDLLIWQGAKADNFKIKKGMQYFKRTGLFDGDWQTFRARKDLDSICQKLKLYEE